MQSLLANLNASVKAELKKEEAQAKKGHDNNDNKNNDDDDDDNDDDFGLTAESSNAAAAEAKDKNTPPFDVTDPNLNVVDVDALVKKLERNDPSVDEVNLNSFVTPDGMPGLPTHVAAVLDALKRNRYVLDAQLTGCALENEQAKLVANVLKLNNTLKSVNLETNNFSGPGLTAIIEALATNETLTTLKLSNQKQLLDTKLEQSLAALLEPNKTLTKLSISIKDVTSRNNVERVLARNAELVRKRRADAKKASGKVDVPKVGGKAVPCHVCKQPVFSAERLVVDQANDQLILHRACFRCSFCKQIVKFGNFSMIDGVFYCMPHYKQKFAEQGGSYANMGDASAAKAAGADKPTPSAIAAKFGKTHDQCAVCDKVVYPTDQVILEKGSGDKALLHKACLKCTACATKLTQATYMLVHQADGEKYYCKRHGKEAEEAALVAKQAEFEGATNMYAAFGKEYGQEAAAKKSATAADGDSDAGDVRVDDAVRSAMSKLNKTESAAAAPAAPAAAAAPVSEAEKAIAASAKRREKVAEADAELSALDDDRERRRREREQRQREIEEAAAREEAEQAARREERRRQREEAAAQAEAEAKKLRDEREAARLERQKITDASRAEDLDAAERAAERERERAKRKAALEAEAAAADRALEERRAARQREREEREAREKAEEEERQRKRQERLSKN